MKKVSVGIILCLVCSFATNAQSKKSESKFSFGPTAGIGSTSVSKTANSEFKLAGSAGLSLVYSAMEHFGLGMDVKYSFEGVAANNLYKSETNLNYVRIPLKAIYFFNNTGDKLRPKLFAGPSLGFLTSAKANDFDVINSFEKFDIGLLLGAGLNYRIANKTWFNTDISYTHGLKDITINVPANLESNQNRNLQLNVGVNFGL